MKKVNVYGRDIQIITKDLSKSNLDGYFCKDTQKIYICKSLKGKEYTSTLWHECAHAIFHRLGYTQVLEGDVEELLCEHFAEFLTEQGCKLK